MSKLILLTYLLTVCTVMAVVKPAGIFTDHAVLQQNEPVRIWGTAAEGEAVTVLFAGSAVTTNADGKGNWMVTLEKMPASSTGRPLSFQGSETGETVVLHDVLVGEVWLAGGQSNMQTTMNVYKSTTQADIDSANDPLLRMVTIPFNYYKGHSEKRPQWAESSPAAVSNFSASAYYFAKNLREKLGVPIGIVSCSVGGTPAETWMSRKTLESTPDLKRIVDGYNSRLLNDTDYLKQVAEYEEDMSIWRRKLAAKETPNPRPIEPMGPRNKNRPSGLHENMLSQTIPYTVRGVIWCQGENNATDKASFHYRTVFSALIREWREEFQNPDLTFLFVQLASYGPASDKEPYWPELRESQSWTEEHLKNTGMIVLVDGGEEKNIHPHSKDKVGYRLSLLARNMVYGETNLICRGPRLVTATSTNGTLELSFKDVGSGLILKPEKESAFEICGKNGRYVTATAKLIDGKIILSSEEVPEPKYARYGWRKWFIPTLFNAEGLPASPFRTDYFPALSEGRYYLDAL